MAIFLFLFAFWLLFNGRVTWDVVILGLVVSGLITWFAVSICGWTRKNTSNIFSAAWQLIVYCFVLVWEIIKANIATIKVILFPKRYAVHPQLFTFDSKLHHEGLETIMANSITITPGTYSVGIYDTHIMVHALNTDFAEGTPGSDLNRRLIGIQEIFRKHEEKKEKEATANE